MKNSELSVRQAKISDLKELQNLFADTISTICKKDYTPEQIKAWISSIENTELWTQRLSVQYFIVAEIENQIVGYASLENDDHLDLLYVHKDHQRRGIAHKLYSEIEKVAMNRKSKVLNSDVSITARPFFEKMGFEALTMQTNYKKEVEIINYKMFKIL